MDNPLFYTSNKHLYEKSTESTQIYKSQRFKDKLFLRQKAGLTPEKDIKTVDLPRFSYVQTPKIVSREELLEKRIKERAKFTPKPRRKVKKELNIQIKTGKSRLKMLENRKERAKSAVPVEVDAVRPREKRPLFMEDKPDLSHTPKVASLEQLREERKFWKKTEPLTINSPEIALKSRQIPIKRPFTSKKVTQTDISTAEEYNQTLMQPKETKPHLTDAFNNSAQVKNRSKSYFDSVPTRTYCEKPKKKHKRDKKGNLLLLVQISKNIKKWLKPNEIPVFS